MPKAQENNEQTKNEQTVKNLLGPHEVLLCEQFAAGKPPWSQRAQALLAMNGGLSVEAAAEASGLRTTQVIFWLNKFDQARMGIFPEQFLPPTETNLPASAAPAPGDDPPVSGESGEDKVKNKNKNMKKNKKNKKNTQKKDKPAKRKKKKKKAKKGKSIKKSGKAKKK